MRKLLFVLLAIAIAAPAFAGDALVLPGGVGRFYLAPVYGWDSGAFDDKSERIEIEDNDGSLETLFNLGMALEYGITDQISAGLQWAPGYNFIGEINFDDNPAEVESNVSNFDGAFTGAADNSYDGEAFVLGNGTIPVGAFDGTDPLQSVDLSQFSQLTLTDKDTILKGAAPLTVGAEIQIMGNQGFVRNDTFMFSVTPGVDIALGQPNWKEQGKAFAKGNDHVNPVIYAAGFDPRYAVGGRMDFDYLPIEILRLNLQQEYRYRIQREYDVTDFYSEVGGYVIFHDGGAGPGNLVQQENLSGNDFKDFTLTSGAYQRFVTEFEPSLDVPIDVPFNLQVSLPWEFTYETAYDVDYDFKVESSLLGTVKEDGTAAEGDEAWRLYMSQTVNVFITEWALPTQFLAYWNVPIAGKNKAIQNSVVLEARAYFSTN